MSREALSAAAELPSLRCAYDRGGRALEVAVSLCMCKLHAHGPPGPASLSNAEINVVLMNAFE